MTKKLSKRYIDLNDFSVFYLRTFTDDRGTYSDRPLRRWLVQDVYGPEIDQRNIGLSEYFATSGEKFKTFKY